MIGVMLFAIFNWFSYFIHINIFRSCVWLLGFWKVSFLFNDPTVQYDYDRKHAGCCPTLYIYGHINGICRSYGKTIFSYTINAI